MIIISRRAAKGKLLALVAVESFVLGILSSFVLVWLRKIKSIKGERKQTVLSNIPQM